MNKIIKIIIITLISCASCLAQDFELCPYFIKDIQSVDCNILNNQLAKCKKKFDKLWTKANIQLGKDSIKSILSESKSFYIIMYDKIDIDSATISLKPSANPICDILYVYHNHWIGSYEQISYKRKERFYYSDTVEKTHDYTSYSKMNSAIIDEFLNNNQVFGINEYAWNPELFWFKSDKNRQLSKTNKFLIQSKIFESN